MDKSFTYNFHGLHGEGTFPGREQIMTKKAFVLFVGECNGLAEKLDDSNYLTHCIHTGREAIIWLKEKHFRYSPLPNIIICNTTIEEIKSFEYIRSLKNTPYLKDIPVIFFTNNYSDSERDEAIKVGANDYFTSNIHIDDLCFRIDFLARLQELNLDNIEEVGSEGKPNLHNVEAFKMWSLKRAFDIVASSVALLLLSPILLLIAILIKLDSKGPIFYVSKRAGKGYQIFNFYKFRSMRINADEEVEKLKHLNQYSEKGSDSVFFKVKNDPRITRLGSFLRKTSLDELPQLFNVLKGDMSLVGNRPLPLYEAEKLTQDQWALRFLAPAGITGLWQITKRGKDDMS
ncbi:MAG: sugar transferase, partial [Cyclobacteriaceae bacterium]